MKLSSENEIFHEVTIYVCSICKDYFDDTTAIVNHLLSIHQNEKNIQRILKKTSSKNGYKNKRIQNINGVYECYECSYISKFATTMKRHILTHGNKADAKHKCQYCPFSTLQENNLKLHIRNKHADGKPEICMDPSVVQELLKKYTDG